MLVLYKGSRFVFAFYFSSRNICAALKKNISAKVGERRIPSIKLWTTCSRKWTSSKVVLPSPDRRNLRRSKQCTNWRRPEALNRFHFSVQTPAIKVKDLKLLYIHRDPSEWRTRDRAPNCSLNGKSITSQEKVAKDEDKVLLGISLYGASLALLRMSSDPLQASSVATEGWRCLSAEI